MATIALENDVLEKIAYEDLIEDFARRKTRFKKNLDTSLEFQDLFFSKINSQRNCITIIIFNDFFRNRLFLGVRPNLIET